MKYSKKIHRIIKKSFGVDNLDQATIDLMMSLKKGVQLNEDSPQLEVLRKMPDFLGLMNQTFEEQESKIDMIVRNLEVSSTELSEANAGLNALNEKIQSMLDSLDEGFLVVSKDGRCTELVSQKATLLLEQNPRGRFLWEILRIEEENVDSFKDWLEFVFSKRMPFETLSELGPQFFKHSNADTYIKLGYKLIENVAMPLSLVLIAKDITSEIEANRKAEHLRHNSEMILALHAQKENFFRVLEMIEDLAQNMLGQSEKTFPVNGLEDYLRRLHTLKGVAGNFHLIDLQTCIHSIESKLVQYTAKEIIPSLVVEEIKKQGDILMEAFELFTKQNERALLEQRSASKKTVDTQSLMRLGRALVDGKSTQDVLKILVDDVLSQPLKDLFVPFEKFVKATSAKLGKRVNVVMTDSLKMRIVPQMYSEFFEVLHHVFANAVDHGIEDVRERESSGKPVEGTITISCKIAQEVSGPCLFLEIADDGGGIDVKALKDRLIKRGVETKYLTDGEVIEHIFDFGFSTKSHANLISGRGVGLDAVKRVVTELNGEIKVSTRAGKGTTFKFWVPYFSQFSLIDSKFSKDETDKKAA